MKERATAISLRGSREYILAVKAVAAAAGYERLADYVRAVLDAAGGEELNVHYQRFVAKSGRKNFQMDTNDE